MNTLSSKLSLPRNVFETASIVYRKALNKNMIQGRTIQSVVAVSLYIASRKCGVLRSLSDIAEKANVPRKTIARNYRYLCKNLKLEVPRLKFTDYIKRLVSRLEVNGETEILALKLVEESINNHLTNGCSPAGVAASCLYIGSKIIGEEITQHQIALEAQITEVTVRNRYKELINNFDINIFV
jgi:transcription initiation factor TFIIB